MNSLQIQPSALHLRGISRTAHFTITNLNSFLALSFQLTFLDHSANSHPRLSLFPSKGVLLKGQNRRITVKYIGNSNESSINSFSEEIAVKFTFKIEYNRHLMIRDRLQGWDQIPPEEESVPVEIQVGGQKEAIEHYIKEDILFKQEFDREKLNISAIKEERSESFINQISFQDLNIDSIDKELPLNSENGNFGINSSKSNASILKEIPIDELCPLEYGQSKATGFQFQEKVSKSIPHFELVESKIVDGPSNNRSSVEYSLKTVYNNHFYQDSSLGEKSSASTSRRNMELIILSIVAAFFVALGNNLGRIAG